MNIKILVLVLLTASTCLAEDKVMAEVNGKPVYESQVRGRIEKYMEINGNMGGAISYDSLDKKIKEEIVKSIILGDLIIEEAKKAKTEETAEYKKSVEFLKGQLMQKIYLEQLVGGAVTDAKIKERYQQIITEYKGKEEYKVSHILVNSEDEAKKIKKELDAGANFAELAKKYSIDNNKEQGGSIDYFSSGQMVEPFEKATEALKVGEISDIVKTDFGYHIIKLEDKRKMEAPSFTALKGQISDELSNQFVKEFIEKLETKNKVEFKD